MEYKLSNFLKSLTKHIRKVDCFDKELLFLEKRQKKKFERLKNINCTSKENY